MKARFAERIIGCLPLLCCAACGSLSEPTRIVLVTVDTIRADHLGCYGYEHAETPNLDRLSEQAVLFEKAVSPVPTTLPAHATMFTGRHPPDHGLRYNVFLPLEPSALTLAEYLSEAGYATAAFPASQIVSEKFGLNQGFETWVEPPNEPDPESPHTMGGRERRAAAGVDLALEWLSRNRDRPLFVWLHLYDPHYLYSAPFPFSARFRDRPYDGEIAYADRELGRLFRTLRDDPEWEHTMLVVAGDHGEGLYDHGERWHSILVYETTLHVPLVIRAPGARARRVPEPVSLADLTPTILDLAGVQARRRMRGISLRPALVGQPLPRRDIYFESIAGSLIYGWQELRGVRSGRWKLIDSGSPELYDLAEDPAETRNLAAIEVDRVTEMRDALETLLAPLDGEAAPAADAPAALDPETEVLLASLGYLGGTGGGSVESASHPRTMIDLEPELLSIQSHVAAGNWRAVEDMCRYTLNRDNTNRFALGHIVDALVHQDRLDEAMDHAQLYLRLNPHDETGFAKTADVHMAANEPAHALAVLEAGLAERPRSERLRYLSLVAAFETGERAVCTERVDAAIDDHPESSRILIMRARCEMRRGEQERALSTIRDASELGFRSFRFLRAAEEFADIVSLPEFEAIEAEANESG